MKHHEVVGDALHGGQIPRADEIERGVDEVMGTAWLVFRIPISGTSSTRAATRSTS